MTVHVQAIHFDADKKLVEYITKRLQKLAQYHDRIIKVDVILNLDNVKHTIKDKIAEIRVHVPRADFFVKSTSKSFEASFEDAFDALVQQIKKKKERLAA
jgi:putative sigma-54 modulation protein